MKLFIYYLLNFDLRCKVASSPYPEVNEPEGVVTRSYCLAVTESFHENPCGEAQANFLMVKYSYQLFILLIIMV